MNDTMQNEENYLTPSQALLLIKDLLPDTATDEQDDSPYICDNINELWRCNKISDTTKDQLRGHIRVLLDDAFSLKEWLIGNGHITKEEWLADLETLDGAKLQFTRQLWLNDMIFFFKLKGM